MEEQMSAHDEQDCRLAGLLNDTRYALRQLRKFACIERALDALERVEAGLESLSEPTWAADDRAVLADGADDPFAPTVAEATRYPTAAAFGMDRPR